MKPISTKEAPAAIGPYSQAILMSGMVFLSGQIPLDPKTGEMVSGDVTAQTERVIENLRAVLAAAECTFANVVKTTIFLTNMDDFQAVNAVYAKAFGDHRPARATVAVAALPRGARVEIEAIAVTQG
jgi:2-iminobutanoate/2-iminopropanoate deaminase